MNILDTRDLIEERDDLKQSILDDFNSTFDKDVDDFEDIDFEDIAFEEDIDDFKSLWEVEYSKIEEIDELESDVLNGEFDYGTTLIDEDDFTDYCEELVEDIGDLPRDLPSYIKNNIDWEGVAEDLKADYSEVDFRGTTYLYR